MSPRVRGAVLGGLVPFVLIGCGASAERADIEKPGALRVASTRGSAVVLSRDERIAVVSNRSAGVVTVFKLDPEQPLENLVQGKVEIDLGEGSEPWAGVIGVDDDTAYLVSRRDQRIYRVLELRNNPHLDARSVQVGSEPTAIAISPRGSRIFVANWGEGTITAVTTYGFSEPITLDLNVALVDTGLLGEIAVRRALAHPRALAMTDNGDADDDETLYATEFFSQPLEVDASADPLTQFDRNRQGIVYPIRLAEGEVGKVITIEPVLDTGFQDAGNSALPAGPTSCFPNQLYSAAAVGQRLFVTSMCASPAGPIGIPTDNPTNTSNFKTMLHPALFVIDTANNVELPTQRLLLTRKLEDLYEAEGTQAGRMPLIPNDIAFAAAEDGLSTGFITALGADAVFRVKYGVDGPLDIGSPGARFLDLHDSPPLRPRLPVGIAVSLRKDTPFALVVNDAKQTMSVIQPASNAVLPAVPTADQTPHAVALQTSGENRGRALFATGLRAWSLNGQAWNSCESCHPDGLSDGLTWFFPRGPRRTISTAGTYDSEGRRRLMLWTANIDEIHDVEAIVRTVAGGPGAVLWAYNDFPTNDLRILYDGTSPPERPPPRPKAAKTLLNNLNGSLAALLKGSSCTEEPCDTTPLSDWNEIDAYIRSVRTPRPPVDLDPGQVAAGKTLFDEGRCAACHAGPAFTLSKLFYTPGEANNGQLPYPKSQTFDRNQLLGALRTTQYFLPPGIPELFGLNPPAASGNATFRRWEPGTEADIDVAYRLPPDPSDQINCILRAVGTFPEQVPDGPANTQGIAVPDAPPVFELRQNMKDLGLGKTGFNIPSLLGLGVGAPYFHAGNARTLEEALDQVFARHHQAFNHEFLASGQNARSDRVRALVAYLLSIDDGTPVPTVDPRMDLCATGNRLQ